MQNAHNTQRIDEYIKNNPRCKISKTITMKLQGKMEDRPAYRLPVYMTFYNIKNGRFAAEYADLKQKENRELDPTNAEDSEKIKTLLIDLDTKQSKLLEEDLLQNGQKDPGIMTYDGYVINGNRRRSLLEKLVLEQGHSSFRFIDVVRLPPNVSTHELWMIEAGIQLSRSTQLTYGPINELLKFKEGIEAGLKPKEIANVLYGGFTEKDIIDKLEELKLIIEYLRFIQKPESFNSAKGIHEHFIDLRKILTEFKKTNPAPDEIMNTKRICFQLIHDGVPAREFRKVKEILAHQVSKEEFWTAITYSKAEHSDIKREKKIKADQEDGYTEARTIFNNCLDSVKAISESQQPEKLLGRALKNLKSIDKEHCDLTEPKIKSLIDEVESALRTLQAYSQNK